VDDRRLDPCPRRGDQVIVTHGVSVQVITGTGATLFADSGAMAKAQLGAGQLP